MKRAIRDLIIGKDVYIESRNEYRQVMLSGQYALISLVVIAFYQILDLPYSSTGENIVFGMAFLLILLSLVFHRQGLHCMANYYFFPTLNILLFLIVSSEDINSGAFIFFIPVALGSFAVFNYRQRNVAVAFAVLSFTLFAITLITDFSIIPYRHYSEEYLRYTRVINFCIAFPISVTAVYLLISLNHHSALQLVESNKQLKKLNDELDRFVYSTSHDLRAPLLSVLGLLKLADRAEASEIKEFHSMMYGRLTSLDRFIKDITEYSRNNRLQIVRENVHVAALANEIWESLKYSALAQDIEFINDIPQDLTIVNDGKRLSVVLSNLIANAIHYHDHRKENKHIRVYHHATASSFALHIEDNGQGIAPEYQTKIFEMFFRGNESSQGSGLGLYIVKETLSKLSGTIQLTSTPRQGSTFSISVPQQVIH
jgi:Signal transduction histidine kinase